MPRHIIEGPDGKRHIVEAPDGATPDQVMAFIREQPASTFDTVKDVAKSAGVGVAQGAIGLGTLPGNVEQLGRMGINAVGNLAGADGNLVSPEAVLPTYGRRSRRRSSCKCRRTCWAARRDAPTDGPDSPAGRPNARERGCHGSDGRAEDGAKTSAMDGKHAS